MDDTPHFTAEHFIAYLSQLHGVEPDAFAIREDVILSYVGQSESLDHWQMSPPAIRIFSAPVLANPQITYLKGPVGAPLAASVMEELRALGAKRLWILGYAGSLSSRWKLGDVAVVTRALSDEGTSRHYNRTGWGTSHRDLSQRLLDAAGSQGPAAVWTTDAIYRETAGKIAHFRQLGCELVDMETACYFLVGEALGLDVAAVMVVSDELYHPWNPGFGSPPVLAGIAEAHRVLESVLGLPALGSSQ